MANVKTRWSLGDVKDMINEVEKNTGIELSHLEVAYNGRLTRSLARCLTRNTWKNNQLVKAEPFKLEFGKDILNASDKEELRQTVLHELAHAIANKRYNANCGHDSRFKEVCREIGCVDDKATVKKESLESVEKRYKYVVTCSTCGQQFYYSRKNNFIRALLNNDSYIPCNCGKCQKDKFTIKQNW